MKVNQKIKNASQLATHLQKLREIRRRQRIQVIDNGKKRRSLTKKQGDEIFQKTEGRCHICGGIILKTEVWQADHVLAHVQGGSHSVGNYLPAHAICNNYRWFYGTEEFQWILKLGVWTRTLIENEDPQAIALAERFVKHEGVRQSRQKS